MSELGSSSRSAVEENKRLAELVALLAHEIDLARVAPEKRLTFTQVCRLIKADKTEVEAVVTAIQARGLLIVEGETVVIAPIDCAQLVLRLGQRVVVEQAIAHAAASRISDTYSGSMIEEIAMLKRSAMVGDIDGYIAADRRLERIIGLASGLPDKAAELATMKREFRRAWCTYNRLRDLNIPAKLRQTLVEAIVAGQPEAATVAVQHFNDYLKQSL